MGVLRRMFGPSKKEIWGKLSKEINGEYVDGGVWKGDKVVARTGEWIVTLDTYTVSNGKTSTTYTRIRAPFINKDGFKFTIYRKSIFSGIGKLFGMQDIEIGIPTFDNAFIIKGNNKLKVMQLLSDTRIRELMEAQPALYVSVKDDEGWFGAEFPKGVDELYFQAIGVIKDPERLKNLFDIFSEVLNQLCRIGSAYENDPNASPDRSH